MGSCAEAQAARPAASLGSASEAAAAPAAQKDGAFGLFLQTAGCFFVWVSLYSAPYKSRFKLGLFIWSPSFGVQV